MLLLILRFPLGVEFRTLSCFIPACKHAVVDHSISPADHNIYMSLACGGLVPASGLFLSLPFQGSRLVLCSSRPSGSLFVPDFPPDSAVCKCPNSAPCLLFLTPGLEGCWVQGLDLSTALKRNNNLQGLCLEYGIRSWDLPGFSVNLPGRSKTLKPGFRSLSHLFQSARRCGNLFPPQK